MVMFWKNMIVLVIGAWVGVVYLAHPGTVYKSIDHYHTVTKTQTKTVPTMPASCKQALTTARQLTSAAARIDSNADQFLDVIGDSRVAIEEGSVDKLNRSETIMQRYSDRNTGAVMKIGDLKNEYNQLVNQCNQETK